MCAAKHVMAMLHGQYAASVNVVGRSKMFYVVTKVADPRTGGNLANGPELFIEVENASEENDWNGVWASAWDVWSEHVNKLKAEGQEELVKEAAKFMAYIAYPVFSVGEILVLDHNDRDQFGRKPAKWSIDIEGFENAAEAAKRAKEVVEESWKEC